MENLSIIIPAYNEESSLERTVENLEDFVDGNIEIIIVEDGCTDRTPEISERLASEYDNIVHIHHDERMGKGKGIESGFRASTKQIVCFMDADKSIEVNYLKNLISPIEAEEADLTIGSRYEESSKAKRSLKREVFSKAYNFLARTFLRTGVNDHQCGFKAFRWDVLKELTEEVKSKKFFWDTELIYRADKNNYKIREVPINWKERPGSSVSLSSAIPEFTSGLLRLVLERMFGNHSSNVFQYLKFASVGVVGAIINTAILFGLTEFVGLYYLLSSAIGIEISIISMFFMNNFFTFQPVKEGWREITEGIFRSNAVRTIGIGLNVGLLYFFTEFFGIYYLLSNIIAIFIASVFNFLGEREFNWNKRFI